MTTIRETLEMIAEDAEADVTRYERQPLDGKTMAAYQAEHNAMIQALAKADLLLLDRVEALEREARP